MKEHRTNNCHKHGHREIVLGLDDQCAIEPAWLINFFEDSVANGVLFKAGQKVQVGWMIVLLKEMPSGDLDIWEPRFDTASLEWTRGVNNTLRYLILQKSVAEMFGVEPDFPALGQTGVVTRAFIGTHNEAGFFMGRDQEPWPEKDSGWFFFSRQDADRMPEASREGEHRILLEIALHQKNIIPFLAMPAGAMAEKNENVIEVELNGKVISSEQNQLLRSLV